MIYNTDPNLTHTVTVPSEQPDPNNPGQFIAGPSQTITAGDTELGGLTNNTAYYIRVVNTTHVALYANLTDALNGGPITFSSLGGGNDDTLAASSLTTGIGNSASLTADDRASAKPETVSKFNKSKYTNLLTQSDFTTALLFGGASTQATTGKANLPGPANENGKGPGQYDIKNDGLSLAGGVAVAVATHDVHAYIGNDATAAHPTTLQTTANVTNKATSSDTTQTLAQSSVSKPGKSKNRRWRSRSASASISTTTTRPFTATPQSMPPARSTVSTTNTYPYLTTPSAFFTSIPQNIVNQGMSTITNLLDGTLGVASNLLNTWTMAGSKALQGQATAWALSIKIKLPHQQLQRHHR